MKMRRTTVTVRDGECVDTYEVGKIDGTHLYMLLTVGETPRKEWAFAPGESMMIGGRTTYYEDPTDEDVKQGSTMHVGELSGGRLEPLYQPVWDWLRGVSELDGKEFIL